MRCKCPYCQEEQDSNTDVGDLDECDNCGKVYQMFVNAA